MLTTVIALAGASAQDSGAPLNADAGTGVSNYDLEVPAPAAVESLLPWAQLLHDVSSLGEVTVRGGCGTCYLLDRTGGDGEVCRFCAREPVPLHCLPNRKVARTKPAALNRAQALGLLCEDPESEQPPTYAWVGRPQDRIGVLPGLLEAGVREVHLLPSEIGKRGPGRFQHGDERLSRSSPSDRSVRVATMASSNPLLIFTDDRGTYVVTGSCGEALAVLPLDSVVGFPAVGVVCDAGGGGNGMGESKVLLYVMDVRRSGSAVLRWPLLLGQGNWWSSVSERSFGASYCHFGVSKIDGAALVVDVDRCPTPDAHAPANARALNQSGRWCFAADSGWSRCR